ncbi:hypothetical protein [Halorubrum californiense]|uniref:hypothetical protein n=1 Tax=Halorubrum californiense TaxID=416585 RepID=UPI000A9134C1|nr:hypothetical protein [Halorubrum californiense]
MNAPIRSGGGDGKCCGGSRGLRRASGTKLTVLLLLATLFLIVFVVGLVRGLG